jgi:hypothetical protein
MLAFIVNNTHWYIAPHPYVIQEYDNDKRDWKRRADFILKIETESNSLSQTELPLFNSQIRSKKFTLP